jgi:RNA polymerase sigma factor (sigma-70 family)
MRATTTNDARLVTAAQTGDPRALNELVATSLPLVYAIVRRALDGHPDTDDVVQDTMVRVVRNFAALQSPDSYRAWLAAIAVHQVSNHLHRRAVADSRHAPLDEAASVPDADAEFADLTILRLELSDQRRQLGRAGRWLDPDDRVLLTLWWLETAGELTRTELAAALGVSVAHAGVRAHRMRQQLDVSREIVAALAARPRCAGLNALAAAWDGTPNPLWRKRFARHIRSCGRCAGAAVGLVPPERLLVGAALLPVPAGLVAALPGKATLAAAMGAGTSGGLGAGANAGLLGKLIQAVLAHPIAAVVTGAVTAGAVVTVTMLPAAGPSSSRLSTAPASTASARASTAAAAAPGTTPPQPQRSGAGAGPATVPTQSLAPGPFVSFESAGRPGRFVTFADDLGVLKPVGADSAAVAERQATFAVSTGLARTDCFSFREPDGRYLRHASWRLRLDRDVGTALFRGDATFCLRAGADPDSVLLEAANYPGWFLHQRGDELWVDQSNGTAAFRADSSFRARSGLASW